MATQGKQTLFITADEAAALPGVSERTLWRPLSVGTVPRPVRHGLNTLWWPGNRTAWISRGVRVGSDVTGGGCARPRLPIRR